MKKLVTLTLAVLMVGLFAAVVFAAVGANDDSTVGTTETSPTTETTEATTTPDDRGRRRDRHREDRRDPAGGVDISGPCDEAEHAIDPRCGGGPTGAQDEVERNDDDGHGRHGAGEIGDDHGDNSGPGSVQEDNFGPGDVEDRSGQGADDEPGDDSHGGGADSLGGGDDDGGHSGHGGGDDD